MSIVVPQLQYSSGGKSVAIAASRRTVKVIPEAGSSTYNPDNNNLIRIDLSPSLGFLDVHNSWLSFRVRTKANTVDHTKESGPSLTVETQKKYDNYDGVHFYDTVFR